MRRSWPDETATKTIRADGLPMAIVDAVTAEHPGRYAGGNHSILREFQVIHAPPR